jgi:hypothetical protein
MDLILIFTSIYNDLIFILLLYIFLYVNLFIMINMVFLIAIILLILIYDIILARLGLTYIFDNNYRYIVQIFTSIIISFNYLTLISLML